MAMPCLVKRKHPPPPHNHHHRALAIRTSSSRTRRPRLFFFFSKRSYIMIAFFLVDLWACFLVRDMYLFTPSLYETTTDSSPHAVQNNVNDNNYNNVNDDNNKTIRYILYYTPYWNRPDYGFGFGSEPFERNCPTLSKNNNNNKNKCHATNNPSLLTSMGDFDAILFHHVNFQQQLQEQQNDDSNTTTTTTTTFSWRQSHQRFVYVNYESPQMYPLKVTTTTTTTHTTLQQHHVYYNNFYNWTMTYRHDSDIPRPYGWFQPKQQQQQPQQRAKEQPPPPPGGIHHQTQKHTTTTIHHSNYYNYYPPLPIPKWQQQYNYNNYIKTTTTPNNDDDDYMKNIHHLAHRPNKVAWIVSNCHHTPSQRMLYVQELAKYIQVDIFGICSMGLRLCNVRYNDNHDDGDDDGGSFQPINNTNNNTKYDNCTKQVRQNYKFYLSFENSFCNDYVTEKFWNYISYHVVIVMGQANYTQWLPVHSYINVMDYASPKALALYLHELDQNSTLYLSYFWWKQYYQVVSSQPQTIAHAMCRLCDKLHEEKDEKEKEDQQGHGKSSNSVYPDLYDWWVTRGQCGRLEAPNPAAQRHYGHHLRVDWWKNNNKNRNQHGNNNKNNNTETTSF